MRRRAGSGQAHDPVSSLEYTRKVQQLTSPSFVDFAMSRVRMLIHFGVRPYLVFDGDYLPSKAGTERDRAARRKESRKLGLELLAMGRAAQAQAELQKAVDVTPEMARQLIDALRAAKVDYVVAPFEADSQLVFLERHGHIDGILSEDSDMLVFGAQCLCTKLDQYGDCIVIRRSDFTACKEVSLVGWSDAEFRTMAILSGCDYLPGIEKMGLKTAWRYIRKHKTVERVVKSVQLEGKMKVPAGYLEAFKRAEATFLYQWVYCLNKRAVVNFTDPHADVDIASMDFIGKELDCATARKVAQGLVHPHTKAVLKAPNLPQDIRQWPRKPAPQVTPVLKQHQSIESFFKPRRTPLAELDPNQFTPSPSQQNLLNQQQRSWVAQTVDGQETGTDMASAMARPNVDRSQTLRRVTSDGSPLVAMTTSKRPRLSTDRSLSAALLGQSAEANLTSRFFAPKSDRASPSSTRAAKKARSGKTKMEIWSDDSVDDALMQLERSVAPEAVMQGDSQSTGNDTSQNTSQDQSQVESQDTEPNSLADDGVDSQDMAAVKRLAIHSFAMPEGIGPAWPLQTDGPVSGLPKTEHDAADISHKVTAEDDEEVVIPCSSPIAPRKLALDFGRFTYREQDRNNCQATKPTDTVKVERPVANSLGPCPLPVAQELALGRFMHYEQSGQGTEDLLVSDSEGEASDGLTT